MPEHSTMFDSNFNSTVVSPCTSTHWPATATPALLRDGSGRYAVHGPLTEDDILAAAAAILLEKSKRLGDFHESATVKQFLQARLGGLDYEQFDILWLDSKHRLLKVETLATGTIDTAVVYPRRVVEAALKARAAVAMLAHNHPSGCVEPSLADRLITERLKQALAVIDVRIADHIIVSSEGSSSFAERGLL